MESPVFELKEEPASPLWELELLDEVGGIWEGDVEVVDEADLGEDNVFWGQADISDIIGKEEQILGLELDEIILEDDLEQMKEEPFTTWLDSGSIYDGSNSVGLPPFNPPGLWPAPDSPADDKNSVFPLAVPTASESLQMSTASADLFKEFEDVLSQATGSLTPPDSPKSANGNPLLQLSADHINALPLSSAASQSFMLLQDMANSPVVNDQLDELVAVTYQKNSGAVEVVKSTKSSRPWDSPSASSSSGSCDSGYEDPDWSPAKSAESPVSRGSPSQTKKLKINSTEERRLRKKEQNKNAATRYRMKKKMEMEEIIGEEKELLDRNENLKSEVVEITREIKYLKSLMGDLFRAKGLIRSK